LYKDLFGGFSTAYERSQLLQIIKEHRPNVIVDAINAATKHQLSICIYRNKVA
jgi:hypothetical protein